MTGFTLPETCAAFDEWARHTGFGWDSPEWGEVLAALDSCDLLAADRLPERSLFDPPGMPLGEGRQVRHLRASIVASARLHRRGWGFDLPTSAQIVAALVSNLDAATGPFEDLIDQLVANLALNVVLGTVDSPAAALASLLIGEEAKPTGLAQHVVDIALCDDQVAEKVFDRLADDPAWSLSLVGLCDGRWVIYICG